MHIHTGFFEEMEITCRYDIICAVEVVEHVLSPMNFMSRVKHILEPEGYVYLTTPNWWGADFQLIGKYHRQFRAPSHLNFFNPKSMQMFMERTGFSVVLIDTPGVLDVDLIRNSLLGRNEGIQRNRLLEWLLADNRDSEAAREELQSWLRKNKLSGSMRCIAQPN